ncbi:sugar ABC transporter substrate-binding protein [Microbacterium sp. RD1]|uniref:sugar ABC transporter substrate-binding protein n=1 Tax=Microbacterium sp. RD1 TaxID=3457313 RepID=UPI003FA56E41
MRSNSLVRRVLVALTALAVVSALSACSTAVPADAEESGSVSVAVLSCTASPYCVAGNESMEEFAAESGVEVKMFDAVLDPTRTVASCNDAISSGRHDAIVISTVIASAAVGCATAADQAGIPLISTVGPVGTDTSTAEPTTAGVVAQVFTPLDDQLRALVDDILVPACAEKDPCEVGWLRTSQSLPQGDAILAEMLQSALESHPHITVVGETSSETDVGAAITATKSFLQRNPELDVILSYSAQGTTGAISALKAENRVPGEDVLIATAGASAAIMTAMRAGEVYGTTVNLPATEMRIGLQLAADLAAGKTIPTAIDPLKEAGLPLVITQENLADYPDFVGEFTQ